MFLYVLAAVAGIAFPVSLTVKKSRQQMTLPTVLSAVLLGCLLYFLFQNYYLKTTELTGENITVTAKLSSKPVYDEETERYSCILKTKEINGEKVKTKLRLTFDAREIYDCDKLTSGDSVSFKATVYQTGQNDSSVRRYYKAKGIYLGGYSPTDFTVSPVKYKTVGYYIDLLRERIKLNFLHDFNKDIATFLIAILSGDKELMDEGLYDSFRKSGIVHIMAVSGLHLSIWVIFLSRFMDFDGRKGKILALIMMLFIFFMLDFADYTGSVRRAGAMALLMFMGKIADSESDSLNSLGFSGICILLLNPFSACDISFSLSFMSTMGILVAGAPLSHYLMKRAEKIPVIPDFIVRAVVESVSISVAVSFFTFPLSLWLFGGISVFSVLTNIILIPFGLAVVLLTGLYTFLRYIPLVSSILAVIINIIARIIMKTAELIGEMRYSYIYAFREETAIALTVIFAFALLIYLFYNFDRFVTKILVILMIGATVTGSQLSFLSEIDKCIIFAREDFTVVSVNSRGVVVGFSGDEYSQKELLTFSEEAGIKIEGMIFWREVLSFVQRETAHKLGTDNLLYSDGVSVSLFDKVTIKKEKGDIIIRANDIQTEIFYEECLQEEDNCDIMTDKYIFEDGVCKESYAFSGGKDEVYNVIINSKQIKVRGD